MLKRRLKEPFGKAGLTVAILALVLAMVGGAYAAGALSGKQKKEVTKIAKKFAGKPGATGPAGANGTNGTSGTKGETGAAGANGTNGTNGEPGETGFTSTLPQDKTETGTWASTGVGGNDVAISFPIPLTEPVEAHFIRKGGTEEAVYNEAEEKIEFVPTSGACAGTVAEPTAEPGHLCVYATFNSQRPSPIKTFFSTPEDDLEEITMTAGKTGVVLRMAQEEEAENLGSWAVSAP